MSNSREPLDRFGEDFGAMRQAVARVFVGQAEVVDAALSALVAGGHLLLEGAPGVGKTLLATTLAEAVGGSLQRIQFTPDLMPADVIGTYVITENAQGRRTFEFHQGPLFANFVLADHINRGPAKTQAALLEAMEAESISVSTEKFRLPQPFFVVATQNPGEMEGTFPLPEPELDRFFFNLVLRPPQPPELEQILDRSTEGEPRKVQAVIDCRRLLEMRTIARAIAIAPEARRAAVVLTAATHPGAERAPPLVQQYVRCGASPRAAQAMVLAAKVRAAAAGRSQASAEDVRKVVQPALRHRLLLNFEAQAEGIRPEQLIDELLKSFS